MGDIVTEAGETTDRLRVWYLVSEHTVQQTAVRLDLRIGEVDPLFDEGLFFGCSTQQHGGIWIATGDNWI